MKIGQQLQSNGKGIIKNQGGRPTKYKKSYIAKVDDYLLKMSKYKDKLPTIEGLSIELGIAVSSIYEWMKVEDRFSEAIQRIKTVQHEKLVNDGVYRKTNSPIVKLILMNNHGYKERTDTTSDNKALPTPLLQNLTINAPKDEVLEGEEVLK
jgi:hypothetical protein